MKKLNLTNINTGLDTLKNLAVQNAGIARDELIDVSLIDLAEKNIYASNDSEENIRELADQIEEVGLLNPLCVIQHGNRYTIFSGERRFKAISLLGWTKVACRVFEGISPARTQLMLHIANGQREYAPELKLAIYEEYRALLEELKASGELKGGIQNGIARLMGATTRQMNSYYNLSKHLTEDEKEEIKAGNLNYSDAQAIVSKRKKAAPAEKIRNTSDFEAPDVLDRINRWLSGGKPVPAKTPDSPLKPAQAGQKDSLSPEEREKLLETVLLSDRIWTVNTLRSYYVQNMPTPKEAIKDVINRNHTGGTLTVEGFDGYFNGTAAKLILSDDAFKETVTYSYVEIDAAIRRLYRENKLRKQVEK